MPEPDALNIAGHFIRVRRHSRAKRMTLRIGADGPVLTLPKRGSVRDAREFLTRQQDWITEKLAAAPKRETIEFGSTLPFVGEVVSVTQSMRGKAQVEGANLLAPTIGAVKPFLVAQARHDLTEASRDYATQIGRTFGTITIRDTKSRWGSCTAKGNLNYSWRLILAPAEVLDYVAAHEICHLAQMNHGPKFWGLVADICPDYAVYRDWLRQNGPDLHRYQFVA